MYFRGFSVNGTCDELSFIFVGGGALDAPLPTVCYCCNTENLPIEVKFSDGPSKAPAPTVTDVNNHLSSPHKNSPERFPVPGSCIYTRFFARFIATLAQRLAAMASKVG